MNNSEKIVAALRQNLRKALKSGDFTEASSVLSQLQREDPASAETRGLELECLLAEGKLGPAEKLARQLCSAYPESSRILFLSGKIFYRGKQYAEAEGCFRESDRLYPHPATRRWLGKTLTQMGRFPEAEAALESLRGEIPEVLLDLAWLAQRRQEPEYALRLYETFIKTNPEHEFARQQLVQLKAQLAEPEELIEQMEALEDYGEQVPETLVPELVHKLFQTGETLRAREEVNKYWDKDHSKIQCQLAWICYHAQAYDLAMELFLKQAGAHLSEFKLLNALETAAARCNRLGEVFKAYHELAAAHPHLYGRIRALSKRKH